MANNTKLKLIIGFLLSGFVFCAPLNCMNYKKNIPNKEKETTKAIKKSFYYTLGTVTAVNCAASVAGLCIFLKSLYDIKNSYTKNLAFSTLKQAINYFSSVPELNKYIIPAIAYGLGVNAMASLVASILSFKAGYKVKVQVVDYAKYTLLPKILLFPKKMLDFPKKLLQFLHITS